MPSITVEIDPHDVLGVAEGATLEEIREAYRRKAKTHHPDAGGETWAFRILAKAYEQLSAARVSRVAWAEFATRPTARRVDIPEADAEETEETIRPGAQDMVLDPVRVVDVEKLWVRREAGGVWLLRDAHGSDRFLSCSLNITWPSEAHEQEARAVEDPMPLLQDLAEVFSQMQALSGATTANHQIDDDRFSGWLSYPSLNKATIAFRELHHALRSRGFSVRSWTRDLTIPHDRH